MRSLSWDVSIPVGKQQTEVMIEHEEYSFSVHCDSPVEQVTSFACKSMNNCVYVSPMSVFNRKWHCHFRYISMDWGLFESK